MSELIKAYSDELNSVYEQIDALWYKADNHQESNLAADLADLDQV